MYSPKIDDDIIRRLYRIGKHRQIPMTHLVNRILDEWITTWYTDEMVREVERDYQIK
jgi:hypothetical protein